MHSGLFETSIATGDQSEFNAKRRCITDSGGNLLITDDGSLITSVPPSFLSNGATLSISNNVDKTCLLFARIYIYVGERKTSPMHFLLRQKRNTKKRGRRPLVFFAASASAFSDTPRTRHCSVKFLLSSTFERSYSQRGLLFIARYYSPFA